MKLNTLEIKGFKSFAEKTTIHFNERITGIVGPNGCGKSNIVDAIRWVLGEQKTSMLRSEKMDNVIFSGTKKRKLSSLAEVTLSFDNTRNLLPTDFSTVTITRKLFRDGDSEYRLNDVPCRLKDIANLFLDTGISSDSYAIIELKMIDEIINDRENSRRKLFEQAAGISKFKSRKKETLNKLSAAEADLSRVEDLLFEIENNLKSLEKQAKRTKSFYAVKAEYQQVSIQLSIWRLASFKKDFQEIKEKHEVEEEKKTALETKVNQTEDQLSKLKQANNENEQRLSEAQRLVNSVIQELNTKQNEKNLLSEQMRFLNEKQETLTQQIQTAEQEIQKLQLDVEQLKVKKEQQGSEVRSFELELKQENEKVLQYRLEHQKLKTELDRYNQQRQQLERELSDFEKKLAVNQSGQENLQRQKDDLQKSSESRRENLEKLRQELTLADQRLKEQDLKMKELRDEEERQMEKQLQLQKQLDEAKQQVNEKNRKIDSRKNEYNLLKAMVDNLEGFPESIRFLKKNNSWAQQQAPIVSDIIYAPELYRIAIETFLEPYLNYYVVSDASEALKAVNLLSDASKGKANFIILKNLEQAQPQPTSVGAGTRAIDVVEVDEKYRKLAEFLLGNVFIVDDQQVLELSAELPDDAIYITRSGKFIRTKYSISGGSVGLFDGMRVGRTKNLEKLKKEIGKLEDELKEKKHRVQQVEQELQKTKAESKQREIAESGKALNQLQSEQVQVQANMRNMETFLNENISKNLSLSEQLVGLQQERSTLNEKLKELKERQVELQHQQTEIHGQFQQKTDEVNALSARYNERNISFHQQKNQSENISRELQYKSQQLTNLQNNIENNRKKITESVDQSGKNEQQLTELASAVDKLILKKQQLEGKLSADEISYYKSRGEVNKLEDEVRQYIRQRQQQDELLTGMREKMNELKLQLASLKERLSIEFNININEIINDEPDPATNEDVLAARAEKIRHKLSTFGDINPLAVEAYDEMRERYDFIQKQRTDLLDARKTLQKTMDEIEESAKEKFLEAFEKVREHFINVFRSLFTDEDDCDLRLTNPENALEADIEIIAKPKGKRPQTINQLSGGEKALTSLALLFSLYLLKPAPFCILDEVDAPLDDANISKFNGAIREFSKDSQFIVVTHNKQTMSSVDIIYGVTMAEQGVSRVVPVDFRSLN